MARLGILDTFQLKDSDDLVIVGRLQGTIHVGDPVSVRNPGDDDDEIQETSIQAIEIEKRQQASEASDRFVGIRLKDGRHLGLKKASVMYTTEEEQKNIIDTYIRTLGETYVIKQELDLSEQDLIAMSITDCAETGRLFRWYLSQNKPSEEEEETKKQEYNARMARLAKALIQKILDADGVYCVYSKLTGEPYMSSRTLQRDEGYLCSPPNIRIFTKAFDTIVRPAFPEDKFEIRYIENGENNDGIRNFLSDVFYLNGAYGVEVVSDQMTLIGSQMIPAPDYSDTPQDSIPLTNPNLVRWMLLLGQLEDSEDENKQLNRNLYYRFMSMELVKARFLIPVKPVDGEKPERKENGEILLKKDTKFSFPTVGGKAERPAVRMYTDWKRLREVFGQDSEGLTQTIDGMITVMDCAINVTQQQYSHAGCYIGKETFEEMKKISLPQQPNS